jgi:hypothetical protein
MNLVVEKDMISFKDFLSEANTNIPDGTIKYLDHRDVWVVYVGGKIIATKKTEDAMKKYVGKKGISSTTTTTEPTKEKEPQKKAPVVVNDNGAEDLPDSQEPEKIETKEYEIPLHNMDLLEKKIEKLNKIAKKLNVKPITINKSEVYSKKVPPKNPDPDHPDYDQDGMPIIDTYMDFVKVTLDGETPKLAGWSFVGKREPLEGSASILSKTAPGHKMPMRFADDHDLTCDHCKKKARRVATFVVKKGRKYMEVGRSCLKDFLGHQDPNSYANYAEMLYNLENSLGGFEDSEYGGGGRRSIPSYDTKSIVAASLHSTREHGFLSNQNAGYSGISTAMRVNQHFNPPTPIPRGMSYSEHFKIHYTKKEEEEAEKIIDWMKNHPKASKEEFWNNISKLAKSETNTLRMTGYLAAGVMMHEKEMGALKAKQSLMSTLKDEYAGNEGDKINVNGTVISVFSYESQGAWGGTKFIITAKTDDGKLVKMFTTTSGIKRDDKVNIKGRVGKTDVETFDRSPFKGKKITTMAPRTRIDTLPDEESTSSEDHYHIGDKIKFRREGKGDGVGVISAKPTYGRFEVSPVSGRQGDAIHVKYEDIISKV